MVVSEEQLQGPCPPGPLWVVPIDGAFLLQDPNQKGIVGVPLSGHKMS